MSSAAKAALASKLKRLQKQTKHGQKLRAADLEPIVTETTL